MCDRERTIRGLECCSVLRKCAQNSCPYIDDYTCTTSLARDALALLREQSSDKDTNVLGKWISVKDSTPTVMHLDCWVMIKGCPDPMIDRWEGDRGEESTCVFPDGEKTFVKSGWYYNDCNEVTHWKPIRTPEPPEEVSRT